MKKGWEKKPLGELSEFQRGLTYAKSDEVESSKNVVLRANNIDLATNRLDFTELKYIRENVQVPAAKIVRPESLLICTASGSKSHLGKVAFIDDDYGYAFGGFMGQLKTGQTLVPKFLFHLMTSEAYKEFITALSDGANINNLKFDDLGKFSVPVPPLAEQRRIVALLDEAFVGIAAAKDRAERNLKHARELFESYLNDVFSRRGEGWEEMRLGDVLATGAGGTPLKSKKEYYEGGDIPWLMSGEVNQREILTATKFITRKGYENSSARMFPKNTVLIAMYGATAGAVGILRIESTTNQAVCGIFPNDNFVPEFLFYVLLAKKQELIDQATGNAQPNISQIKVKNTKVPIIPIAEQINIVATVSELSFDIQRLESIYHQKLAALDELKKSILHKAFSGELSEA